MHTKRTRQAGIGFGLAMSVLFILQNLLMDDNATTGRIVVSIIAGLIIGMLSGLSGAWLLARFGKSKFVVDGTRIEIPPGETILLETPAAHFKGIEGVGGKLYLTDRRLVFKSHKLNLQSHLFEIDLTEIKDVNTYRPLGLNNNGLSITTAENNTERFVVEQVDQWVKFLGAQRVTTKSQAT